MLRRRARDLADVQYAIEAFPEQAHRNLSVPAIRARLRDVYGVSGERLKECLLPGQARLGGSALLRSYGAGVGVGHAAQQLPVPGVPPFSVH